LLAKQFEMAKIDEAKESSVIQVLDKAVVPEQKSKPARSKTVLFVAVTTGLLSIALVFIFEAYLSAKKDSESAIRLKILKNHLLRM